MPGYIGDFNTGATVRFSFNTRDATGAPITLAGTPAVSIYKGGSTTEVTTGATLTVDYDSRTGLHRVVVDTSSDGTFYATANEFFAVITTGTVSGVSVVGSVVGHFSLENRNQYADVRKLLGTAWLTPGTAGTPDVNAKLIGGTSQTGRDIGLSVLISAGTGTGQLDFTSGIVKANAVQLLGTAWLAPGTAGTPDVNTKLWNGLATVALPLVPTVAGRTLDVSAGGEAGIDWANVGTPGSTVILSATTVATLTNLPVMTTDYISATGLSAAAVTKIQTGLATPTNITAGTITTVTNLTNVGLKKNTSLAKFPFMMTDSTTHAPTAGATVTVTRSIDGAAFAAGTLSSVTNVGSGDYTVDFAAADLNGNTIVLRATAAGFDDMQVTLITNP